jgi:adenylate cyclase
MTSDTGEIRAALDSILTSEVFAASERHRDFLRFLVEETLAGRGDRLKGYTIAIEVFGKDPDFDPQNDSLVRVEAGRLRKRLGEYYKTAGKNDAVRIELKRGSYAPEFVQKPEAPPSPAPLPPAPAPALRWPRVWPVLAGALGLIGITVLLVTFGSRDDSGLSASTGRPPGIRVRTFDNIGDPDFDYFASGLTQELLIKLDRDVSTWGPINVYHEADLSELEISDQHEYLLDGTVSRVEDAIRVTARIVDTASGEQIWTDAYNDTFDYAKIFATQDAIAIRIADAIREPVGSIADAEVRKTLGRPPANLTTYECNLLFLYALDQMSQSARTSARQCLETNDQRGMLDANGLGALAFLHHLDYQEGRDFLVDEPSAVDAAYDAAQRALDQDGNSIQAHIAMAFVHLDRQRFSQARSSTERMLSQNPPPSLLGIGAWLLVDLGNGDQGMALYTHALAQSPRPTPSLFVAPTVYYLEHSDFPAALDSAQRIDAPEFLMFQVFWAALTAEVGETDRARRHVEIILSMQPEFGLHGREIIDRWALPAQAAGNLIEGLGLAGIVLT